MTQFRTKPWWQHINMWDQARARLADAIHFRRNKWGYWTTDLNVDWFALQLIQNEYRGFRLPRTKDADEILLALSDKAWCCFVWD